MVVQELCHLQKKQPQCKKDKYNRWVYNNMLLLRHVAGVTTQAIQLFVIHQLVEQTLKSN